MPDPKPLVECYLCKGSGRIEDLEDVVTHLIGEIRKLEEGKS